VRCPDHRSVSSNHNYAVSLRIEVDIQSFSVLIGFRRDLYALLSFEKKKPLKLVGKPVVRVFFRIGDNIEAVHFKTPASLFMFQSLLHNFILYPAGCVMPRPVPLSFLL
jgi:hypothetical protein